MLRSFYTIFVSDDPQHRVFLIIKLLVMYVVTSSDGDVISGVDRPVMAVTRHIGTVWSFSQPAVTYQHCARNVLNGHE